jgi:hypothetical protein
VKVWTVVRLCSGKAGGLSAPCVTYSGPDGERLAKGAAEQRQADIQRLFESILVRKTSQDEVEPVGLTLAQLLATLGIEQVVHFIHETEVKESDIVVPQGPKIILAH